MEIPNEIKFKVALQYYGQPFLVCYNIENKPVIERFEGKNADLEMYEPDLENKRELLILRPLSEITDEDAIEVVNICNAGKGIGRIHKYDYKNSEKLKMYIELKGEFSNDTCVYFYEDGSFMLFYENAGEKGEKSELQQWQTLPVYQFLQSKGYDIPHYLLGCKTLKEVGVAIYEY